MNRLIHSGQRLARRLRLPAAVVLSLVAVAIWRSSRFHRWSNENEASRGKQAAIAAAKEARSAAYGAYYASCHKLLFGQDQLGYRFEDGTRFSLDHPNYLAALHQHEPLTMTGRTGARISFSVSAYRGNGAIRYARDSEQSRSSDFANLKHATDLLVHFDHWGVRPSLYEAIDLYQEIWSTVREDEKDCDSAKIVRGEDVATCSLIDANGLFQWTFTINVVRERSTVRIVGGDCTHDAEHGPSSWMNLGWSVRDDFFARSLDDRLAAVRAEVIVRNSWDEESNE